MHGAEQYAGMGLTYQDIDAWRSGDTGMTFPDQTQERIMHPMYHSGTRMEDGEPVILVDPGSVGNLVGDQWAKMMAGACSSHRRKAESHRRERPLSVSGVGHGSQACKFYTSFPIAIPTATGCITGSYKAPTVPNSQLPALLGLHTMRQNRT